MLPQSYKDHKSAFFFVSELTLSVALNYINDFTDGISKDSGLWHQVLSTDRSVYQIVSESYEMAIEKGAMTMKIHQISEIMGKQLDENGLGHKIPWMREQIDRKYKNPNKDTTSKGYEDESTVLPRESSSTPDFSTINQSLIDPFEQLTQINNDTISYLRTHEVESDLEVKFMELAAAFLEAVKEKAKFVADGRQKICKLDQVKTLELSETCTLNSIYDSLTAHKMHKSTVTSKQMGKTVELDIKDVYKILRPMDAEQAIQLGLVGIKCEMCNEFRLRRKYNSDAHDYQDYCLDCGHWQPMKLSQSLIKA